MKTAEDFKRSYGTADAAFVTRVHQTLRNFQKDEEEAPVKKISTGLIFALVLVLLVAVAFAAATQLGILDFIQLRSGGDAVLQNAPELIQKDLPQQGGDTTHAIFSLREAAHDGENVYLVVAAKPTDPKTLLIGSDAMLSDSMSNFGPQFKDVNLSVADYAQQNGYESIVHVNIGDVGDAEGAGFVSSIDYLLEGDGTLVFMLNGQSTQQAEELPIHLVGIVMPFVNGEMALDQRQQTDLTFTLTSSQPNWTATNTDSALFADCGVQVDRITLSGTAMSTNVRIEYTVVDPEAYALTDDGLWFEFLDDTGARIATGAAGTASVEEVAGSNKTQFVQIDCLMAMEGAPRSVTLRGYNSWEKNRYETHAFTMK